MILRERFEKYVEKTADCWLWVGAKRNGYGCFKVAGEVVSAHRLAWELYRGEIPDGKIVCHKCGNKNCVSPEHLYVGTHQDNTRDAIRDGVHVFPVNKTPHGSANHNSKLKESDVKRLRILRKEGWTQRRLAEHFDVHRSTIISILTGHTWGWLI